MYLTSTIAKGKKYIYLRCHSGYKIDSYGEKVGIKKILFALGRNDKAIKKLYEWKENFNMLPDELKELGCTELDILDWINTIETGITKAGNKFSSALSERLVNEK